MSDKIKELVDEIKSLSKMDIFSIEIIDEKPKLFESKIGGIPYWTQNLPYPENSEGKKLYLLAQINFEKEKTESPLPTKGILQFFISDNDLMGLDLDHPTEQKNFRVIYHENIDYTITKNKLKGLNIPTTNKSDGLPIKGEYKIILNKGVDYINTEDINFKKYFSAAYKKIFNKDIKKKDYYDVLDDEEVEKFEEELQSENNHKMLGYANFTQQDPRCDKKYKKI